MGKATIGATALKTSSAAFSPGMGSVNTNWGSTPDCANESMTAAMLWAWSSGPTGEMLVAPVTGSVVTKGSA
jgi:hypothetical protein